MPVELFQLTDADWLKEEETRLEATRRLRAGERPAEVLARCLPGCVLRVGMWHTVREVYRTVPSKEDGVRWWVFHKGHWTQTPGFQCKNELKVVLEDLVAELLCVTDNHLPASMATGTLQQATLQALPAKLLDQQLIPRSSLTNN